MKLYEPLIERDLDAIPDAVRAFLDEHSPHDLFVAVARFAVLAYAPSQHAKRAVMACRAAWDLRDEMEERWPALLIECARYAAASRQPWSEPPILDDLEVPDEAELRRKVNGDALLMLDTAVRLIPSLGEKGRGALLRMPVQEMEADPDSSVILSREDGEGPSPSGAGLTPNDPGLSAQDPGKVLRFAQDDTALIDELVQRVVDSRGAVDTVREVFIWSAKHSATEQPSNPATQQPGNSTPPIYPLARDYAQTLIAHATPLPAALRDPFLAAVHHNLAHGESFAEWSFA